MNECRVEAESVCIYNSRSTTACFLNASALPRSFSESRWWMKCLRKLPNTCSFHWPSCKAMPLYFQSSVLNGINFRWQSTAWLLCTCADCLHSYALSETWDMKLRLKKLMFSCCFYFRSRLLILGPAQHLMHVAWCACFTGEVSCADHFDMCLSLCDPLVSLWMLSATYKSLGHLQKPCSVEQTYQSGLWYASSTISIPGYGICS